VAAAHQEIRVNAARRRVRAARAQLALAAAASAALWGGAAAIVLFVALALLDLLIGLPLAWRALVLPATVIAFAAGAGITVWRGRRVLSIPRVALWIEERTPALRYALVTSVELGPAAPAPLEQSVAAHSWDTEIARTTARAIARPLVPLILALAALGLLPTGAVSRMATPAAGDVLDRAPVGAGAPRSLLAPLTATIRTPAYAGGGERVVEEPVLLEALPGGTIVLRGRGSHERVRAVLDGREVRATAERDRWRLQLAVPSQPVAVRLSDGVHQRLVTIEPLEDAPPVVTLSRPTRDTVMREARGTIALEADVRDDHGIARASFEYIISSGAGELFSFRTGTLGGGVAPGARNHTLRATLSLDELSLGPGDVVHLRAAAWDANGVSGPGMGSSETRTFRVARSGEYDTLAVEGAPPPELDADAVSQRMLLIQTQRLEARRRRIPADTLIAESRALAQRQNILRRRVAEIVFMRLGTQPEGEHAHGPGDGHDHSEEELASFLTPERLIE
jgi:hypothetical protein